MILRKPIFCFCAFLFLICAFFTAPASAAQVALDVPLAMPKLQSLTTSVAATGGAVDVSLALEYDAKGSLLCAAGSTIDGAAATCTGAQRTTASGWTFSFSIKNSATTPKTTLTISGTGGAGNPLPAKCVYNGPKGKANIAANSVTFVKSNATANVAINAVTLLTGKMSGTGEIVSGYGNDASTPGKVTGSISKTGKVNWTLTQGKGKVSFSGTTAGETTWTGTVTATLPPAKTVVTGFSMTSIPIPPQGTAFFEGTLSQVSSAGASGLSLGGIITISTDRDGNGKISASETRTAYTDSEGWFSTSLDVVRGIPVVVKFEQFGFAAATKVYASVNPGSIVTANGVFAQTGFMDMGIDSFRTTDGKLTIADLPASIIGVSGKVFNPVKETYQFPGTFADSTGKRLVASVFSSIYAVDGSGQVVKKLTGDTTIKMFVPQDTWSTIKDLTAGTGKIDVPLYYFDEDLGQWKRGPDNGWLVTDANEIVPETDLAAIQGKTYDGTIYATGKIAHLSSWSVAWPEDTHTCICGRIVSAVDTPVAGATVSVRGVTYTDTASLRVTGADGRFCAEVVRSEDPGDGFGRSGYGGDTDRAEITVSYKDSSQVKYHLYGPYDLPATQAACGSTGCANVGDLSTTTNEITPTVCALTGTVVFSGTAGAGMPLLDKGDPVRDVWVFASDPDAYAEMQTCREELTCTPSATSASDGTFSITSPVLTGLEVFAIRQSNPDDPHKTEYYEGHLSVPRCTSVVATVNADYWSTWIIFGNIVDDQLNYLGGLGVMGGSASIHLQLIGNHAVYVAEVASDVPEITGPGPWFTAPLKKLVGKKLTDSGTISFTVTGQDPVTKSYTGALTTSLGIVTGATWLETGADVARTLKDIKDAKARVKGLKVPGH